jgi:hypothetical protein
LWFSFDDDGIANEGRKSAHTEDRMQEVKRLLVVQKDNDGNDVLDEVAECSVMAGEIARAVIKVR